MKWINEHYRVIEYIMEDACGTIYRVHNTILNRTERLKVFNNKFFKENAIRLFAERFIELSTITHPNIIKLYEFSNISTIDGRNVTEEKYFYTYEDTQNITSIDYLELSREESHRAILEVCRAIQYLHFRSECYMYLNFENVIFYKEQDVLKVKLNDLSHVLQYKYLTKYNSREINQFLSLKLVWADSVDLSADLYSLGIVFYYLYYKYDYRLVSLSLETLEGNAIHAAIHRLTTNIKEEAYSDICAFIKDLVKLVRLPYEFSDRAYYERLNFKNRLIGRDKEIARIVDMTEKSINLKCEENCMVVHGRKGVGKSRLLKELNYRFLFLDYSVFNSDTSAHTGHFKFFKKVISDIALNDVVDINLIRKYGDEIGTLLPKVAEHWRISTQLSSVEEMGYLRIANRVYKFIEEYVSKKKMIFIIDNIKHMDYYDLKIIEYLVNTEREIPLFVITTADVEENYMDHGWFNFSNNKTAHMSIVNYGYSDASEFLSACLGQGHEDIKFVSAIMTRTNGNPSQIMLAVERLFNEGKIYVDDERKWNFSQVASFMDIDIDDEEEEDYVGLENFDHMELRVLMFLSICDIPVIDEIIMEVLDLTAEEFEDVILQLKETQVVDSKFSDWGFSYYVDNRVLKRELAAMIPKIDRLEYNKKIAMYLESKYLVDKKYLDDRLIYHLEQSEEHEKCASYSLIYAERLKNFSLKEAQSLIYYNKALQHAKAVDNDALTLSTHLAIGDIYQETDQFDEALMNYKSAEILAAKNEDIEKKIDAINKIGVIELKRLNYDESKRLFLYTNKMSRMEHYKVGEVRSAVHLVDYYFERQMYKQAMTLIDYYIPLCDSEVYHRNLGHLYHRKAAYYYMGDFYLEAKECYEKAVDVLTGSGNEDIMSLCLNNLGAVELEYLGNSKKALEFFMMAEDLDLRNNIFNDLAVFKANIGAAYFKLDQHEKAIETYEQAITMAMESNDKRDFFIITKEVIRDYGVYGYYDKAYSLLKKLEIDYSSAMHVAKYHDQHDFMNIEYYLLLENYDMAYKWYVKYKSHKLSNHSRGFSIKLLETIFEENHLQTTDNVTESLLWRLSQLRDSAVSVLDYQLLRNFTLRMAKKLLTTNNYILIKKFVDYDTTLIPFFDSAFLRLYHAIFEALFSENRIEGFVALTHTYTDKKYDRINWIGHKLLANEYHQAGSYYKAMVHYTTALDMVKGLTYLLPDDLKRSFIVHDALKLQMKNRISELFGKIIHGRGIDSMLMIESEINSVEEFFDISSLNSLFKNDRFSQDVYEAVFKDQFDQVMAVEDVVSKMEHYSESNIYNILTYYMQILCADYGRIVFKDNNNEIYKRFDLGKPCSNDIDFIKNSLYYENEGVFVNVNEESLYSYLLKDGRKSILYIPIFERISHKEKEAINQIAYENEIGYVYLESNKVLNNFNADNFEKCRLMLNLVKAILENYRLKILSSIDKLTGVYLRKYTEERFSEQLVLARRENAELSVIMCDIDKFKYVNDTYGHLKGDEILRRIGRILNEIVEPYGLVGRYGGEEFIAILPNISLEDAMKISESVRMRIQEEIRVEARKPVTISLGVSSYPNHGLSEEELVENADKALYYSKNTGRNKSTAWSKEISGAHYRFDRLAGILTGNSAVDATNMQSIVEIIAMLKLNLDKNGKLLKVLENLIDITKAEMAYVVELNPSGDRCVYMKERGANQLNLAYQPDLNLLDKYLDAQTGDYFVNWDDVRENDFEEQMPDWRSIIVTPLFDGVRSKGIVVVEVPIIEREFDFNNYNYVNLMSGLISAII